MEERYTETLKKKTQKHKRKRHRNIKERGTERRRTRDASVDKQRIRYTDKVEKGRERCIHMKQNELNIFCMKERQTIRHTDKGGEGKRKLDKDVIIQNRIN